MDLKPVKNSGQKLVEDLKSILEKFYEDMKSFEQEPEKSLHQDIVKIDARASILQSITDYLKN